MTLNILSILLLSLLELMGFEQQVTIVFVGDAMQHTPQTRAARQADGSLDYSQCFTHVQNDIRLADYAVANLECPLGGKPYSGYPCFSAPDEWARQLKATGFDLLLTANNHCLDRRDAGLRRTIAALDSMGIPHIGTYTSREQREAQLPFIVDIKGIKVAMLCYTYSTNGIPVQGNAVVDLIDRQVIGNDIDKARQQGATLVCVNLHWGEEYHSLPSQAQTDLADWLVQEKGVDLVIGGHPHVIQPMEMRHSKSSGKDAIVVYSLGNFISNQVDTDSRGGAMVIVTLGLSLGKVTSIKAEYKLFFCQKPSRPGEVHQLIPSHRQDLVRPDSRAAFGMFMRNARYILNKHNIGVCEADTLTPADRPFVPYPFPALDNDDDLQDWAM